MYVKFLSQSPFHFEENRILVIKMTSSLDFSHCRLYSYRRMRSSWNSLSYVSMFFVASSFHDSRQQSTKRVDIVPEGFLKENGKIAAHTLMSDVYYLR